MKFIQSANEITLIYNDGEDIMDYIADDISSQHTATYCNTLQHTISLITFLRNTLQHTATHCNILQHTATHYIVDYISSVCNNNPNQITLQFTNLLMKLHQFTTMMRQSRGLYDWSRFCGV